ncbi:MAG: LptA/OstA family protein [Verrucomicrobiaceae bacterium]
MKKIPLCLLAVSASHFAWGQASHDESSVIPRAKAVDAVEETGHIIKKAATEGKAETERVSLDQSAGRTRLEQVVDKTQGGAARQAASVEKSAVEAADRKLEPVLKRVAPEGKALIAQSSAAPALRAPDSGDTTATAVRAKAAAGDDAAPIPLVRSKRDADSAVPAVANPGKTETAGDTHIDIVSQGALYFDSAQSLAVFTDDVVVNHPQFHLTSDELQVYMLKEEEKNPKVTVAPTPPANGAAPKPKQDSSVKQAIATGRKVVIQKRADTGEMQIGICRSATYIGENGDIILREMPKVQRGKNLISATDPSTYMILKQNGELKVFGPARTEIIQEAGKKEKDPAAATTVAQLPPVAKPVVADKPAGAKGPAKKKDKGGSL